MNEALLYLVPAEESGAIVGERRNPIEAKCNADIKEANWREREDKYAVMRSSFMEVPVV